MHKQPCQVGWIPAPRGWEGKTRHRAGVRASGTAVLLTAACLQHPEGHWMGCFLGSATAELPPKVAEMGCKELGFLPCCALLCCICPPRGAWEEQKAGGPPRHKQAPSWAEMDHFGPVERSNHTSVPGSLWLAGHGHLLQVSRVQNPVAHSWTSASWSHGKVWFSVHC